MIAHFISLTCPDCDGKLEIYDDMDQFRCGYCGAEMAVRHRGGTVVLEVVTTTSIKETIRIDKGEELDLIRLKEEAQSLLNRREGMLKENMIWQKRGYLAGTALLLVGFMVVRFGGFVIGLSAMMGGILTINFVRRSCKTRLADVRELDVKIDVLNGRIEDREKLLGVSR